MDHLISIVINNYNYGRYIRQAIESAISQTYKNIELIIVDDGSTDESKTIINEYSDRAQVILKENGGQASALNAGIAEANGRFIILLDSDDYLFPETIEVCAKVFPEGYSRVFYRLEFVDGNNRLITGKKSLDNFQEFDGDVFKAFVNYGIFPAPPTSGNFFDAKKLKDVLPIPESEYNICADLYLYVKTSIEGPVRSINRKLAAYRIHGNNNFYLGTDIFDNKRLKNQIRNIFLSTALIDDTCKKLGYYYKHKMFEKSFFSMHILCAGHKLGIDSPYNSKLKRIVLIKNILHYLRVGPSQLTKRIVQTLYLLAVIFLPSIYAKKLLRHMNNRLHR
jgi:glycosyltransferase involved in cell wall biosynthesis